MEQQWTGALFSEASRVPLQRQIYSSMGSQQEVCMEYSLQHGVLRGHGSDLWLLTSPNLGTEDEGMKT